MIPLYHDFSDATVLIFGGGSVGARKAKRFVREARVIVISPAFGERFEEPSLSAVEQIRAKPDEASIPAWIDRVEPALVVAATDSDSHNATIAAAARKRDILINRTDRSGERPVGSVVVPATVEDDPVSVAISTGGASPALSRYLRQQIEAELENAGAMAELTGELRNELKEELPPAERQTAVRSVVRSPAVWKALHTGVDNAQREAARVMDATDLGDEQ